MTQSSSAQDNPNYYRPGMLEQLQHMRAGMHGHGRKKKTRTKVEHFGMHAEPHYADVWGGKGAGGRKGGGKR